MAVYTKINSKDIHLINSRFNIDKIKSFHGIKKGIENTNYLLKTKNEKFILTIFEKRVSNKEIPFFMKLMDNLNQSKISCPKPLKDKNRNFLFKLKNKTACVVTFLKGKDKQILNTNNCYQIGKIISKMHSITKKLRFSRKNSTSSMRPFSHAHTNGVPRGNAFLYTFVNAFVLIVTPSSKIENK